ncbi:hypothetical protein DXX93_11215 [Thalassotalea euphylliae]|uniref:Uncharacterized protein n=1 Tax=Thalassotalea euphylliae TaxID=1655234 RepID=A0A3E0TRF6_9GAMM|nr:hypothetical protein [Thalassotalea euphylliae]REL27078.1 hypothetical protein DXX93_11215 [Thalassotalea euphylliae]
MNLFSKILFLTITLFAHQADALTIQQDNFIYTQADKWKNIIGLSQGGFILKKDSQIMTFESWKMRELLGKHKEYVKSLNSNQPLYGVEDFIFCSLGEKCIDDSLKRHLMHVIPPNKDDISLGDSCASKEVKCVVFNTEIDEYTFEAYIYSHTNENYFIRILTNIDSKTIFLNHLNQIELDPK